MCPINYLSRWSWIASSPSWTSFPYGRATCPPKGSSTSASAPSSTDCGPRCSLSTAYQSGRTRVSRDCSMTGKAIFFGTCTTPWKLIHSPNSDNPTQFFTISRLTNWFYLTHTNVLQICSLDNFSINPDFSINRFAIIQVWVLFFFSLRQLFGGGSAGCVMIRDLKIMHINGAKNANKSAEK